MLDILILAISLIFVYVNVYYASKCNLQVLGLVAGLILILTGFWLLEPVCIVSGFTEQVGTYNMTTIDNVTYYSEVIRTQTPVCTEIETDYFNFFDTLQIFCFLGGIYFTLEFIFRQSNL